MKKAPVLGGGGVTGTAWEIGLLSGLQEAGVDLSDADTIVGTSAGSIVGAALAAGLDLMVAMPAQEADPAREARIEANMKLILASFSVLKDPDLTPEQARARLGELALSAPVDDEEVYLQRFVRRLPADWPAGRRLRLTGVDAVSGEPVVWDGSLDEPLLRAVAASCAVPCVFPPITIRGRRYMDGGMRSATNADLAAGASSVIVVAPTMEALGPHWPAELATLGSAKVLVIGPNDAALTAFGTNIMNSSRAQPALAAGRAQAAAQASEVRAVWSA